MMKSEKNSLPARSGGFTLIELIIVVVILGIAATIAVPMLSSAADMQVRSAANQIAADLEYAKSMAMTHQKVYTVVFDTANESYEIQDETGAVIKSPVRTSEDYVVDFASDSRLDRVNISTAVFNSVMFSSVTFDYLGSPYAGSGTANALNAGTITLEDDTGTYSIDVDVEPMTGYVTISGL